MRLIDGDKLEQKLDEIIKDYECMLASSSGNVRAFEYRHLIMFIKNIVREQPTVEDAGGKK